MVALHNLIAPNYYSGKPNFPFAPQTAMHQEEPNSDLAVGSNDIPLIQGLSCETEAF